jgi:hypothetical protein
MQKAFCSIRAGDDGLKLAGRLSSRHLRCAGESGAAKPLCPAGARSHAQPAFLRASMAIGADRTFRRVGTSATKATGQKKKAS